MKRFFVIVVIILSIVFPIKEKNNVLYAKENDISFSIATGKTSSLLVTSKGNVYAWGLWGENQDVSNSKKYMGPTDISSSFPLKEDDKIVSVASGEQHSLFLSKKGKVFAFGSNDHQQLIYSNNGLFKASPIDLSDEFNLNEDEKIIKLACGSNFSLALTNKNQLYSFGNNEYGQLGNGKLQERRILNITNNITFQDGDYIKDVVCGGTHSLILTNNGHVYGMGNNNHFQLGNEDNYDTPVKIFPGLENIVDIACGKYSSYVLTAEHQLFAIGSNSHGQIADNKAIISSGNDYQNPYNMTNNFALENEEYISKIYAGYYFCIVKTNHDNYFSFGENSNGQLGNGTTISTSCPTKINLDIEGDIINNFSLSENHCLVSTNKGKIYTWGSNSYGQLAQDFGKDVNQLTIYDITYLFPPIVELSLFSSSISSKIYVIDVKAYYLDESEIKNIFYTINDDAFNGDNWEVLNTSKVIIDKGEGNVYLHLKISSEKEDYLYTSGPFYLDHISPTIQALANNTPLEGKYINNDVKLIAEDNVEGVIIKYYKDDKFYQGESQILLNEDGTYKVYSEDVAGNVSSEIEFIIDKSFPSILSINNFSLTSTSFTTNEKIVTIQASESIACYNLKYQNEKEGTLIGLNNNEKEFSFNLKKGTNTIMIYDLAGNVSEIYQINYAPKFFQDSQLMLIVFGSITLGFILIVLFTYLIKNKAKFFK